MSLDVLTLLGSAGGPSALALGIFYLLIRRDLREVQDDVRDLREEQRACQSERRREEAGIHSRITDVQQRLAYQEGKRNGAAK